MKKPIFILTAFLLIFYGCTDEKDSLTLVFTGDIIMHIPVKNCAFRHSIKGQDGRSVNSNGFDFLFEKIRPELISDASVGNMEFPTSPPYSSEPWIFNCQPEIIQAMKKAGFAAVTVANNHIMDQDEKGADDTISALNLADLKFTGAGRTEKEALSGITVEGKGIRAGILACTGVMNRPFPAKGKVIINRFYDRKKMLAAIDSMKQRSDFVILIVHTGTEYMPLPLPGDSSLMKEYMDAGADLIIGHHPHIVQPAEEYTASDGRHCAVFYSLGNFISNQDKEQIFFPEAGTFLSKRNGLIVKASLKKYREGENTFLKAEMKAVPVTTRNYLDQENGLRIIQTDTFRNEENIPVTWEIKRTESGQKLVPLKRTVSLKKKLPVKNR